MAQIELKNISKRFGAVTVLDDINISIKDKEFLALVGPSGCGKSTLLRMIAGLESLSGGEIHVDGKLVNSLGAQHRDFAMVFQTYALYPHMNTAANIGFPLKMRGLSKNEIEAKVADAANTLELTELLDRLPKNLSGGQRQRVAMGRAIVRDPKAFLFDEPLSNLDAKLRTHMRTEIRSLHQELGATSIYVTHDQVEAMTMADRIIVLNKGGIEQSGSPIELFDKPANTFVAGFLGAPTMNIFGARTSVLDENRTQFEIADSAIRFTVKTQGRENFTDNETVQIGMRPQHISLSVAESENSVKAEVLVVEQTGCETIFVVKLGNQLEWTVQTQDRARYNVGDLVHLTLTAENLHVFDQIGKNRLN